MPATEANSPTTCVPESRSANASHTPARLLPCSNNETRFGQSPWQASVYVQHPHQAASLTLHQPAWRAGDTHVAQSNRSLTSTAWTGPSWLSKRCLWGFGHPVPVAVACHCPLCWLGQTYLHTPHYFSVCICVWLGPPGTLGVGDTAAHTHSDCNMQHNPTFTTRTNTLPPHLKPQQPYCSTGTRYPTQPHMSVGTTCRECRESHSPPRLEQPAQGLN